MVTPALAWRKTTRDVDLVGPGPVVDHLTSSWPRSE